MAEQNTQEYYTTLAVARLFENDSMRLEFMDVYKEGPEAAKAFLAERLDMPPEMADAIVKKKGADLNSFVGENVCTYLW